MSNRSTHGRRWGIVLGVLWGIALLLSFTPPEASARVPSAQVVVPEQAGAGRPIELEGGT